MEEIKFGNWRIADGYLEWTVEDRGWYEFQISDFGRRGPQDRNDVVDVLVHLPEKSWITRQDMMDLNDAAQYAYKNLQVAISSGISWEKTMTLQDEILKAFGK